MNGSELRQRRRAMGLSQESLGRLLGISRNTIARWERGEIAIEHGSMLALALDQIYQIQGAHNGNKNILD